jgi:carboxypeptidase PM20D1
MAGMGRHSAEGEQALERLRQLIRVPTISGREADAAGREALERFRALAAELYPRVHEQLELELVAGHTLLLRWPGRTDGAASVLMAHYDVVAAEDEGWAHPPFAAELTGEGAERLLWGRGTLDDKGSVVAVLEAVERSLAAGVAPEHDVYLLFGHDEETHGTGAAAAAELLVGRGVRIGLVLDEGGAVVERLFPTVDRPIAVVGVSEKGTTNFTLTVEQQGGHASTPPALTATARLARAITRLTARPFRARMNDVTVQMIETLGPHARGPIRFVFTRARLFRPLLTAVFARMSDETAAIVRTSMAVTQLQGSQAANALAERAQAVLNVRIAIGSTVQSTRRHLERAIADPLVRVEAVDANDPARVSRSDGPAWELLAETITAVYPEAIVTPYVQTGATDSRRFSPHSRSVYRFSPFEMSSDERATLHARDERIHVATWLQGIRFYETLLPRL